MDYKTIIDNFIKEVIQTGRISVIKEGTFKAVPEKRSLYIVDENGKDRFLGFIPYEIKTNDNKTIVIDEDVANEVLEKIQSEYTVESLKEMHTNYISDDENRKEVSKANLVYLKEIQKLVIDETNGTKTPVLKRHPREYYYYFDVKFNDGDLVRIFAIDDKTFNTTTFNGYMEIIERLEISKAELTFLLKHKIKTHFELQKKGKIRDIDNAYAKEMRQVRNSRIKVVSEFIFNGRFSVIIKAGDIYECLMNNKRFTIGSSKNDKEIDINEVREIENYLKINDVKFYYVLNEEEKQTVRDLTDEQIKELKFIFI